MRQGKGLLFVVLIAMLLSVLDVFAASPRKYTRQEYIDQFAPLAIEEMNEYHVPASITMAQACLESRDGNSELALKSNNHFGIKCNNGWTGPTVRHDDESPNECFRKYNDPLESFRDHSRFLVSSTRYQFLFDYDITDYKKWAHGLRKAGYATDPNYPSKLIKIIEDFQLDDLDGYYRNGKLLTAHSRTHGAGASRSSRSGGFTINPYESRAIERRNGSKAFMSKVGDTYEAIASEFGMREWEIFAYNDAQKGSQPEVNTPVYIQHKKSKAPRGNDFHVVQKGESLRSIAQWYGVKLKSLYRLNNMRVGEEPQAGQQISLRKKIK